MSFTEIRYIGSEIGTFFKSPLGKKIGHWLRRLFVVAVIGLLLYQLTGIGWSKVFFALPTNPLFYVIFAVIYISLPVAEIFIYRLSWRFSIKKILPVFMIKRVYNKDVIGYSGEAFFYLWAQKNIDEDHAQIFKTIKDYNILSSIASTSVALGLFSLFLLTQHIQLFHWFNEYNRMYLYIGDIFLVMLIGGLIVFRHVVISMPMSRAGMIFSILCGRLILTQFLMIWQWHIILPNVDMNVWYTLISVGLLIDRIPLLPNLDVLSANASIKISPLLKAPTVVIAAIMLVNNALTKLIDVTLVGISSLIIDGHVASIPGKENTEELAAEFANGSVHR